MLLIIGVHNPYYIFDELTQVDTSQSNTKFFQCVFLKKCNLNFFLKKSNHVFTDCFFT
jgi:hypothetical protein